MSSRRHGELVRRANRPPSIEKTCRSGTGPLSRTGSVIGGRVGWKRRRLAARSACSAAVRRTAARYFGRVAPASAQHGGELLPILGSSVRQPRGRDHAFPIFGVGPIAAPELGIEAADLRASVMLPDPRRQPSADLGIGPALPVPLRHPLALAVARPAPIADLAGSLALRRRRACRSDRRDALIPVGLPADRDGAAARTGAAVRIPRRRLEGFAALLAGRRHRA
jgi:hypothetical protein